ncbi:hypothetical protein C5S31_01635 [ANME-1 cluster archaeon GoMg2]|nr:hypothetical protein [ANME-1 cluster archaeon GoMg2]
MGKLPEGLKEERDKEVQKLDEFLTKLRYFGEL